MNKKSRFLRVYSNLPLDLRKEIILIIKEEGSDKPMTWNVAFDEVSNDTALSQRILDKMVEMELI